MGPGMCFASPRYDDCDLRVDGEGVQNFRRHQYYAEPQSMEKEILNIQGLERL